METKRSTFFFAIATVKLLEIELESLLKIWIYYLLIFLMRIENRF